MGLTTINLAIAAIGLLGVAISDASAASKEEVVCSHYFKCCEMGVSVADLKPLIEPQSDPQMGTSPQ